MNSKIYIADSSVFIEKNNINIPYQKIITTISVENEMINKYSKLRFEIAKIEGMRVESANPRLVRFVV